MNRTDVMASASDGAKGVQPSAMSPAEPLDPNTEETKGWSLRWDVAALDATSVAKMRPGESGRSVAS